MFIFAGTRISETAVSYLTTDQILAVDDILTCESDPSKSTVLQITGRDLSSRHANFNFARVTLAHSVSAQSAETVSLRSPISSRSRRPVSVVVGDESSLKSVNRKRAHVRSLSLEFDDATKATQFCTELTLQVSLHSSSSPSTAYSENWLDKYRMDITRKYAQVALDSSLPVHGIQSSNDIANKAGDSVSVSPDSFTPSTSSESLYDDENAGHLPQKLQQQHQRAVSVPSLDRIAERDGGGETVDQGQEALAEEVVHWETGDCSLDETSTALMTAAAKFALGARAAPRMSESLSDLTKCAITGLPVGKEIYQKDRRCTTVNFMPDPAYRSRLNADLIVRNKLEEDEASYCSWKTLSLFVGTWNVNGRQDPFLNLDSWIHPPPGQAPADIYVFGFQELDLNLAGMALNKQTASPVEAKWLWLLETSMGGLLKQSTLLPPKSAPFRPSGRLSRGTCGGYKRLSIVRLAGLLLVVYVSSRLYQRAAVSEVSVQSVPTGMFNVMGNKGAVGLRLTVYNHSLCFVNCHLAAGSANCERRNQDYGEICRKMMFERNSLLEELQFLRINDHDQVFLFGDLNYRITGLDASATLSAISRNNFTFLLDYDELLAQRKLGRTLQGFSEGKIAFAPTYKFELLTDNYFTADGRVPSYCDRILWKGKFVEQLQLDFLMMLFPRLLPHCFFFKLYDIKVRCVDQQLFTKAYEAVIRSQDLFYNMLLPQASLTSQEVEFGPVRFEDIRQQSIVLTNTGHSALEFKFTQEGAAAFPPWLHVAPPHARVEKGASCEITFDVYVNPDCVASLQSGLSPLSCIIVLTLVGGKDYFISISGQFIPTCFGLPLSLLLRLPDTPVACIPSDELKQMIRDSRVGNWREGEPSVVPQDHGCVFFTAKEVYRMADFIAARFDEPDLFRQPELRSDIPVIRDTLDTTTHEVPIPETVSVHSVVYCLLVFLSALPEPVIPYAFQQACIASVQPTNNANDLSAYQAISKLPIDYQNIFFYLVSFIRQCLSHGDKNGTNVNMLASTFADIILRDPPFISSPSMAPVSRNTSRATNRNQLGALNRQELKVAFLQIFITSDTEDVIRRINQTECVA
ncbi:unnamed protein product [Mesocestoides corti]|uniref:Rho-GAP domain-containing protein n=1 Tax=Mesocestoides corti TaxID=53468 RepID=A0A3P6HNB6_MESCO|nr:unnamed protein product [Mesocestoides corti]